ncbi:unnamed protein product [Bemisia tabaci]|uniref:Uncharacterized protein n=1 Tax=Bemisia tabaci TaxID=7038 RepID=A0A9P0AJM7_BEMTA|nr:unnamed protein product [Bemisia tabaci]
MSETNQEFCLRWSSFHQQLGDALCTLLEKEYLVDVTLTCEGQSLKAHQTVLSAGSSYFQKIFNENTHPHPIVILKDVRFEELSLVIKFMYYGEVNVENDSLPEFLKTAEMLQIKGLTKSNSSESSINSAQNLAESDYDTFDMKKIKTDCESFDETSSNHTNVPIKDHAEDRRTDNGCTSQMIPDPPLSVRDHRSLSFDGLSHYIPDLQDDTGQHQNLLFSSNLQSQSTLDSCNQLHSLTLKPPRQRVLWTKEQLKQLDSWYRTDRYPNGSMMCRYADVLCNLGPSNIQPTRQNVDYWFQNRRRRDHHPDVVQQRERKKLAKSLWNNILLEQSPE